MTNISIAKTPLILFGAFDRHNFGDLLFPHIIAALLPDENLLYAGLVERDLRLYGGHDVRAIAHLANELKDRVVNILHVGGELLTCSAWQAAVMLLKPESVQKTIRQFELNSPLQREWVINQLGLAAYAPYCVSRQLFPNAEKIIYNAVGGVELNECEPAMRAEVVANLQQADYVSVRDNITLGLLSDAGITAQLMPDSAVMVAELFADKIDQFANQESIVQVMKLFPQGFIAVQFSAAFGDDSTLILLAHQLDQICSDTGFGIVFFRAGAAPWHDDIECYQRIIAHMKTTANIFSSLNIWEIVALISRCQMFCGSSLHGKIVAMSFALPAINLSYPTAKNQFIKQLEYAKTWDKFSYAGVVEVRDVAQAVALALAVDPLQRQQSASELAVVYRQKFKLIMKGASGIYSADI